MTQYQRTPPRPLPACRKGHAARYFEDLRAAHAGGGHTIECECGRTVKCRSFDAALSVWYRMQRRRAPRIGIPPTRQSPTPHSADVLQLRPRGKRSAYTRPVQHALLFDAPTAPEAVRLD